MKFLVSKLYIWVFAFSLVGLGSVDALAGSQTPSLNDVLTSLCVAPFCKDYSGGNRIRSADGTMIAVKDWAPYNSNKPTFLFIHGFPHGQGLWIAQVASLLPLDFRLVTMDTRGGGGSDVPLPPLLGGTGDYSNFGDDIQAVIDRLKLKNVILVGHSYGGVVINSYVAKKHALGRNLNPVKGIIEVGSVVDLSVNSTISLAAHDLVVESFSPDPNVVLQALTDFIALSHYQPFPSLLSDSAVNMDLQVPFAGRLGQITSPFGNSNLASIVQSIDVPVLIIQGLNDAIVDPLTPNLWTSLLANSPAPVTRLDLPNTGHFSQLEQPLQFNAAIRNFANQVMH